MSRVTRSEVADLFVRFAGVAGKEVASSEWPPVVGTWRLDYYALAGGYRIAEYSTAGGGEYFPFGSRRRKAAEFVRTLMFAIDAIGESKGWPERNTPS